MADLLVDFLWSFFILFIRVLAEVRSPRPWG